MMWEGKCFRDRMEETFQDNEVWIGKRRQRRAEELGESGVMGWGAHSMASQVSSPCDRWIAALFCGWDSLMRPARHSSP